MVSVLAVTTATAGNGPYVVIALLLGAFVACAVFFGVQQDPPRGLGAGLWAALIAAGSAGAGTYFIAEAVMKSLGIL
ncbi:hypothetical protein P9869_35885 [Streptomyces ossamyceticus]|nr:hypothetical protein [Streptomyces ossamyceticus]